jgi:hypothetical protein
MPPQIFKPSQALVDVLLKHSFTDQTQKLYPAHYKRMKEQGYDPYTMKRIFSYPSHEDYILFHYVYVTLHHQGAFSHTEERKILTGDELRSLIAFYKLPVNAGREWLDAYANALDLHKYYKNICLMPDVFNSDLDVGIRQTFDGVMIHR